MGGMSDYALEVQMEQANRRPRRDQDKEKKNVPMAVRDTLVEEKIAECIKQGINPDEAESLTLEWNAEQASPMKIGLVKQRVFLAYRAAGATSQQ